MICKSRGFHTFITLLVIATLTSCNSQDNKKISSDDQGVTGAYMNMLPTDKPKLLAPELLASSLQEYNGTFNPEGNEFYFTTNTPSQGIICYTKIGPDNEWQQPRIASFSGKYSEYDPLFTPDGSKLYFSSERPVEENGDQNSKTNIWVLERRGSGWSEPIYVDLNGQGNYYSSIANSGNIYFNVWDNGDMFKAVKKDNGYEVEKLPEIINSQNGEGDPFISPEEDYIIFRGYNNSLGNGDLYISFQIEGSWTNPENLGQPINSKYHEICPYVTIDGKYFIFSSSRIINDYEAEKNTTLEKIRAKHQSSDNGELNIYYMSSDFIQKMKSKHL